MDNDITLYEIPASGGAASLANIVQVSTPILAPLNPANYSVSNQRGYKLLDTSGNAILRMIRYNIIKLTAGASICELSITDVDFILSSGFNIEYPIGYASMRNDLLGSVALKTYFPDLGSRLRVSPAVSALGVYTMPAGTYTFSGTIIYGLD